MFSLQTLSQIAGLLPPRAFQPLHQVGHFAAAAAMPALHGVWMRGLLRDFGKPAQLLVAGEPPWANYLPQRRLRREGFTWQVSNLAQDMETLYRDFHVPFIQRRSGAHAHVARPWLWQRQLAHGGVQWVMHKGRRVAGLFFTIEGKFEGQTRDALPNEVTVFEPRSVHNSHALVQALARKLPPRSGLLSRITDLEMPPR